MAVISWLGPISGNWNTPALWAGGAVPQSADTVEIGAIGSPYTVTVSSAASASLLDLESPDATLLETSAGTLDLGSELTILEGTAILNGLNTIATGIVVDGGKLETGRAGALGAGTVFLFGGKWLATRTETVANNITASGSSQVAAAHGHTLALDPATLHLVDGTAFTLTFGNKQDDGTVSLSAPGTFTVDALNNYDVHIAGGTLTGSGVQELLTDANITRLDAGATIDMGGNDVIIHSLQGAGTILDAGPDTLRLQAGDFAGKIGGALQLEIAGTVALTGDDSFSGGTLIDPGDTLTLGNGTTAGTVKGPIENNGFLVFDDDHDTALHNAITGAGEVTFTGDGTFTIDRAEAMTGDTHIEGNSTVSIDRGTALGTGTTILFGKSTLLATRTLTLSQLVASDGPATGIEAAHGKTLTLGDNGLTFDGPTHFGSAANDGTIVLNDGGTLTAGATTYEVNGGTLRGDAVDEIFGAAARVIVRAGATADLNASTDIVQLSGAGTIRSFAPSLEIDGGAFGGTIGGTADLIVGAGNEILTLTANKAFSGTTTIDNAAVLRLGNGGTTGTISGSVSLTAGGVLEIDHSNTLSLGALHISGAGSLVQAGSGTTRIDAAETYTGGTTVAGGVLSIDRASAIGSGQLTLAGGGLLATKSIVLANQLNIAGDTTIAAAHGATLDVGTGAGGMIFGNGAHIVFGTAADDGTVNWHFNGDGASLFDFSVEIAGGTLRAADTNFGTIADYSTSFRVDAGANLNLASHTAQFGHLSGGGTITGKSGIVLDIQNGSFAGQIDGGLAVWADNAVTLSGGGNFSGGAFVQNGATLTLIHAAQEDVRFDTSGHLVLKTPGSFTGTIRHFTASDTIDLANIDHSAAQFSFHFKNHELTVTDGTHTDVIHFAGSYTTASFHAKGDGHGGTIITDPPLHDSAMEEALAEHARAWFDAHAHHHDGVG